MLKRSAYCSVGPRTEGQLEEPPNRAGATMDHRPQCSHLWTKAGSGFYVFVSEGAECLASGVYIKHVLEQLTSKGESRTFDRLLRRFRGSCWSHWAPR